MTQAICVRTVGGSGVLQLEDVTTPEPGPGLVRVRVHVAGVNAPDLLQRSGRLPAKLPFIPGSEVVGVVDTLGPGVDAVAVGTRVYALLPAGGGYAQHVVAPSTQLTPVPTGIRDEEALGLGIQGLTALLLLRVAARLQAGEQVFVPAAAGGVGHLAVQMAKRLGAACVIAGASTHDKRRLALELGADASVDTTRDDWPDQVRSATNQRGCDVVLAMTSGEIVEQSLRALAPLGRLVLFGADNLVNPAALDSNHMRVLLRQAQSLGGFALMQVPGHIRELALSELFEAVAAKSLRVIAHERYRLADAASAHAALESRRTIGRVFLNCD